MPIEEFPCARIPDIDEKLKGDPPSATPIPMSSKSIGKEYIA